MDWLIYLAVGALAGVLAGLFGVGGGAIIVPILIFLFKAQALDPQLVAKLAIGTSFATIVLTALSSVHSHHRRGNVDWSIVRNMVPGLVAGVVLGSIIATRLHGAVLELLVGLFLAAVGLQMLFSLQPRPSGPMPAVKVQAAAGGGIGFASAFFGIAGGSMTVPFLSACSQPMRRAVATSAACGIPIAVFGATLYAARGWSDPALPAFSLGYIYVPAMLGIAIASLPCAQLGARLASGFPEQLMKRGFALMLIIVALQLFIW